MALPATMKVLGLGLGILVIVLVGVLSEATVRILLKYSKGGGSDSYAGLMDDAFGDVGKKVLESCVVINNLGVLVIYMIILGKFLKLSMICFGFFFMFLNILLLLYLWCYV